ncbi:heterogeneous nuclear ribonucleoprotein D-like [Echinops telfairi]|uniref:Heterogeneous nuclear ribonucleoprotein D-like n=1 Tax=Echinops telfairi TaxID=9371 RepID=A0AC55D452_ECHTE|nr:heterogeneous nuclear ribonucleoprotein D-like [Echinops telfairi]
MSVTYRPTDAASVAMNQLQGGQYPEGFAIEATKRLPDPNKVFIGGLSDDTSKQALLEYLSQFGEIMDFIIKINRNTGLSRRFGFVVFKDSASVEKVLQVKEHKLDGKIISLKRAIAIDSNFPVRKVFVGGLNPGMPVHKIRQYFETFGVIQDIELPVWPNTNKRRAFGFITYKHENAARKLLDNRYHLIGARPCEIKIAHPQEYGRPRLLKSVAPFACRVRRQVIRGIRPNQDVCGANPADLGTNPGVQDASGGGGPDAGGASYLGAYPGDLGTNPAVQGTSGGGSLLSILVPVPSSPYNQVRSDQIFSNTMNVYNIQPIFSDYGGGLFPTFGSTVNNVNVQISQAAPYYSGYQASYQPF